MEDKLNKFKWIIVISFILYVGWIVTENVAFDESEFVSFEDAENVLIDEYFDEDINETVYVYRINKNVYYNITNHNLETAIVCYFNNSLGYYTVRGYYRYNRGAIRCVRENTTEQIEEAIHGADRKILIDQYFDENINETVSVYRIIGYPDKEGISWNMTNRIPNSTFVCSFDFANHTVVRNHNIYINYRRGDIKCVRENLSKEIKVNKEEVAK